MKSKRELEKLNNVIGLKLQQTNSIKKLILKLDKDLKTIREKKNND